MCSPGGLGQKISLVEDRLGAHGHRREARFRKLEMPIFDGVVSELDDQANSVDVSSSISHDRIIIVANQLPVKAKRRPDNKDWSFSWNEDSLLLQFKDGLPEDMEVIYVGSLKVDVDVNEQDDVSQILLERFKSVPVFLPLDILSKFYNGFWKQQLWPHFHYMLPFSANHGGQFDRFLWEAYVCANKFFSQNEIEVINLEDDYMWIHDYHLMVQIANLARGRGRDLEEIEAEIRSSCKRINDEFRRPGYEPILFIDRPVSISERMAFYTIVECVVVTAVKDGMNLTPYEYIVSRQGVSGSHSGLDSNNPKKSMLVVSEFIGCSPSLSGIIRVNPWNVETTADAMNETILMAEADKQLRHEKHYKYVSTHDVAYWSHSFLQDMERTYRDHFRRCWGIGTFIEEFDEKFNEEITAEKFNEEVVPIISSDAPKSLSNKDDDKLGFAMGEGTDMSSESFSVSSLVDFSTSTTSESLSDVSVSEVHVSNHPDKVEGPVFDDIGHEGHATSASKSKQTIPSHTVKIVDCKPTSSSRSSIHISNDSKILNSCTKSSYFWKGIFYLNESANDIHNNSPQSNEETEDHLSDDVYSTASGNKMSSSGASLTKKIIRDTSKLKNLHSPNAKRSYSIMKQKVTNSVSGTYNDNQSPSTEKSAFSNVKSSNVNRVSAGSSETSDSSPNASTVLKTSMRKMVHQFKVYKLSKHSTMGLGNESAEKCNYKMFFPYEVLIQWKGLPVFEATWEDYTLIQ